MMRTKGIAALALWLGTCVLPVLAVEGRVPVIAPMTITDPGSYIVTQDFSVASGDGITISASNVTLDLNGHTITGTVTTNANVRVTSGFSSIRIRNGRLVGGQHGILAPNAGGTLVIAIERVEILDSLDTGIQIETPRVVEILESIVRPTPGRGGISIYNAPFTGRLIDNTIDNSNVTAIFLAGCYGMDVRGNTVMHTGNGTGMSIQGSLTRIVGNSLYGGGSSGPGIDLGGPAGQNLVLENTIDGFSRGIYLLSTNGNRVAGNVLRGLSSNGVEVVGPAQRNLIENNQIEGSSGCGISFATGTTNAYRNNMLRGNSGGAVCGAANTDAGGNIL